MAEISPLVAYELDRAAAPPGANTQLIYLTRALCYALAEIRDVFESLYASYDNKE